MIVPIENPLEVVSGARAKLGAPIEVDLDGRGIRSLERIGSAYLVVAGPPADIGSFALYRWSGQARGAAPQAIRARLGALRPEALFEVPGTADVQILSDDGGVEKNGVRCKDRPPDERSFRSITVRP